MKQMKKLLAALLASALLLIGCTGGTSPEGSSTASGEASSTVSRRRSPMRIFWQIGTLSGRYRMAGPVGLCEHGRIPERQSGSG